MHYNEFLKLFLRIISALLGFLPLIFWILLIFSLDKAEIATLTILCTLIHELGHEAFIFLKTGHVRMPKGRLNGFVIRESGALRMSYREEAMLYLSGPLANIAAAVIALPFFTLLGDYALLIATMNAATAISSLIPVEGYDGYGVLRCFLLERFDESGVAAVLGSVSFVLTALLSTVALYVMDRLGEGYWIFAVFTVSLIGAISKALKNTNCVKK